MDAIQVSDRVPRDATGIKCVCGGYADEVECTQEEIRSDMNCGRSFACCVAAFVCILCQKRLVGTREAPEME